MTTLPSLVSAVRAVKQWRRARLPRVIHELQLIQEQTAQLWQSAEALQAAGGDFATYGQEQT